jgi:CheY-like chemotaxis protein
MSRSRQNRRARNRMEKGRILLLEDHIALASLRRDFLVGHGYEVVCSKSGEDALRLLESQPFQLLVADALLAPAEPGDGTRRCGAPPPQAVSGWEVAAVAKQRGVPVILSSGWPVRLGALELRNLGVDPLCPKPCSLDQLLHVMETALTQSAAAAPQTRRSRKPGTKGSVRKPRQKK